MPRSAKLLLLALFVVADVALVYVVYRHVNGQPPPSDIAAPVASTEPPSTSAQRAFAFTEAEATMLDVANDGTTVFATRGTCGGAPAATVETGEGEGAALGPSADTGLTTVLSVRAASGGEITLVGAGEDCEPTQLVSTDAGETWTPQLEVTRWHVAPDDARAVVSPLMGESDPGCLVTSLSHLTDEAARVTCVDGVIRATDDGGESWDPVGRLDNVRTGFFASSEDGFALATFEGCAAFVFETDNGGADWQERQCLTGDPARAIAMSNQAVLAVVGDDPRVVYGSDDGAETFSTVSE